MLIVPPGLRMSCGSAALISLPCCWLGIGDDVPDASYLRSEPPVPELEIGNNLVKLGDHFELKTFPGFHHFPPEGLGFPNQGPIQPGRWTGLGSVAIARPAVSLAPLLAALQLEQVHAVESECRNDSVAFAVVLADQGHQPLHFAWAFHRISSNDEPRL